MNVSSGSVSSGTYLGGFVAFAQPTDLLLAEFKAFLFGFIAVIVACHKGLAASGGAKGVADAVNQAVVLSVIALAVVNVADHAGLRHARPAEHRLGVSRHEPSLSRPPRDADPDG
jgi:ABC-type transporter Mla maintaining outer membrane lipid asymmetry permease subunit MlaE